MNLFRINSVEKKRRGGFSLIEATFSIGLLSFGFLVLAPLLAVGLKSARLAQNDRATAQIAQTLMQEAQQGTLPSGTVYLNFEGNPCNASQAVYTAKSTSQSVTGNASLTRLAVQVSPVGAPDRARTYALVFQAP